MQPLPCMLLLSSSCRGHVLHTTPTGCAGKPSHKVSWLPGTGHGSPGCQDTSHSCCAGSFSHFLNFQIAFVILMQIGMCLFCAVGSYIWRQQYGNSRYFLGLTQYTQVSSGASWAPAAKRAAPVRSVVGCLKLLPTTDALRCSLGRPPTQQRPCCVWCLRHGGHRLLAPPGPCQPGAHAIQGALCCRATTRMAPRTPSSC